MKVLVWMKATFQAFQNKHLKRTQVLLFCTQIHLHEGEQKVVLQEQNKMGFIREGKKIHTRSGNNLIVHILEDNLICKYVAKRSEYFVLQKGPTRNTKKIPLVLEPRKC